MQPSRRNILIAGGVVAVGAAALVGRSLISSAQSASPLPAGVAQTAAASAAAASTDPRMADRGLGKPDAPVRVAEWFSLTCPHCARFAAETLPQVIKTLVDPGRLYYVFKDFPLDQVALTAAMVARSLPAERYWPFCEALLGSQDRWAFARGVNSTEEIAKTAALAGMSRASFDSAIADDRLRAAILQEQDVGVKTYNVDSTPFFIFNGAAAKNRGKAGEMSFDDFAKQVASAAGA